MAAMRFLKKNTYQFQYQINLLNILHLAMLVLMPLKHDTQVE